VTYARKEGVTKLFVRSQRRFGILGILGIEWAIAPKGCLEGVGNAKATRFRGSEPISRS
jgi:hypothetical protein